jgi:hypothetical protein
MNISDSLLIETSCPIIKKRGKAKNYDNVCSFKSLAIAEKALFSNFLDSSWVHKNTTDSLEGEKRWYHCKIKQCPVVCQLILIKDSLSRVTLLMSDDRHSHENIDNEKMNYGIDPNTKEKINELIGLNCKPAKILIELRKQEFIVPTQVQLYNYIKYHRTEKLGSTNISLNDLKNWASERMAIPEDVDKMFVGDFEYQTTPNKIFRLFLTTRRLISFAKFVSFSFFIFFFFFLIGLIGLIGKNLLYFRVLILFSTNATI